MITFKSVRDTPQYGSVYAHDVTSVVTSVAQNDWDQIVAFDTNGVYGGSITPDHTNNHIVIGIGGRYKLNFSWSGYGPASSHQWWFQLAKNNMATQFSSITDHVSTPTTQELQSAGRENIVDLLAGDTIELWVQRISAGSNIPLTTVHAVIELLRVGP